MGPPLLWLHGFTQTRSSAAGFRSILAEHRSILTVDLPGHGDAASVSGSLWEVAAMVAAIIEEPLDVGGYSMGGRVALHLALAHPDRVRRLVVLGATRGIEDDDERRARRERDNDLAERLLRIGAEEFLREWLAQPMFATLPADARELAARSRDAAGLARSLRDAGTGTQEWLGERLRSLRPAMLALAGERDTKFSAEATALATTVPRGRRVLVPGAGHAAHLERPDECAALIEAFLAEREEDDEKSAETELHT